MKIGAAVPLAHEPPVRYKAIREFARLIEERGLDSVWVFDHLLFHRRSSRRPAVGKPGPCYRRWPRLRSGWSWGCWSRRLRFVIQPYSPR